MLKGTKLKNIIYQHVLLRIITSSSMENVFCKQQIDSEIKRYEEIRKLTKGQDEDYTTRCLLHYNYIKNLCTLIAVDLSRWKELDADPKAIPQM